VFVSIIALCILVDAAQAQSITSQELTTSPVVQVASGLNFPEGPAFDGRSSLLVSNCYGGYIARFGVDGKPVSRIDTAFSANVEGALIQKTNGLTHYRDGSLFVCDFGRKAVIRIFPDGRQEIYADSCNGSPFLGPNDLAFDPDGNLFFTDPTGTSEKNPTGAVYCVVGSPDEKFGHSAKREVVRVADGLAFPNGIAVSRTGKYVFVAESRKFQILRFAINTPSTADIKKSAAERRRSGKPKPLRAPIEVREKTVVATMPTEHDPDGMAFDQAGRLWVAQFGAGKVCVFSPQGKLVGEVELPAKNVTNVEFAGEKLTTLFITTADKDNNALYAVEVKTPGLRLLCAPESASKDLRKSNHPPSSRGRSMQRP
jgi:gluconolactonase